MDTKLLTKYGREFTDREKQELVELLRQPEFDLIAKIFRSRFQEKNSLLSITGQPFADGILKGRCEEILTSVHFLLDISAEARKSSTD
jgi:hypothetical protein